MEDIKTAQEKVLYIIVVTNDSTVMPQLIKRIKWGHRQLSGPLHRDNAIYIVLIQTELLSISLRKSRLFLELAGHH